MRAENQTSDPRSSSAIHLRGLFLALLAVLLHPVNSAICKDNLDLQHCRNDSDGVHGLDCYGRYLVAFPKYTCTWKPGRGPSGKTYTLLIKQTWKTEMCQSHTNITGTSTDIKVFEKDMRVELFEHDNSSVCTKAVFQGLPKDLVRCGPPESVSFSRFAGRMAVNVTWMKVDVEKILLFDVRYRTLQGNWSQSGSENATRGAVASLDATQAYTLQVRCQSNQRKCTQCLWSHEYHVLPELTTAPDLGDLEDEVAAETPGRRRLSLTWKFASKNTSDGYLVSIGKASGEAPREEFRTTEPRITFLLSYSSYRLEVSAFNRDSTSPALRHTITRRENQLGFGAEGPNVTVRSNSSFNISWRADLARTYVCYSAEWTSRGQKAAFVSFYSQNNYKMLTLKNSQQALEPFRRYTLTLHARPDGCKRKRVNGSESTYGSTHFYFMEGAPVGAPANVSIASEKLDSAVLRWRPIPEEEAQGFLLGYVIYCTEYQRGTRTENNETVNPDVNSHTLEGLKSGTPYEVQISGFTRAGVGVRSDATAFTLEHHNNSSFGGFIKYAAIVTTLLLFVSPILKRAKRFLWPSIPNPKKSNVMQKMEMTNQLELLQSISTLRVEEWDTDSLQIVQKDQTITACVSAETPSLLDGSEDEFGDVQETRLHAAPLALAPAGGYTTMEMFRQAVSASTPGSQEREPDAMVLRSQMDYVRQFSTDSTRDNQALQ